MRSADSCFTLLNSAIEADLIPTTLNDPFGLTVPVLSRIAAHDLQKFLVENDSRWVHNFGTDTKKSGVVKGKMFGVLVVRNTQNELGYLATFSGKIADENPHPRFVPSVFDISSDDYFINRGMHELTHIGTQIKTLEIDSVENHGLIDQLKTLRKIKSNALQQQLFAHYHFLNQQGESQNILDIFKRSKNPIPPSAAGECAAPKLLNYAFKNKLKPIAIAEFWWGASPKSQIRKHGEFYPACEDKCRPILGYMLE